MNKQEIMELLNIGENREVEFKESYKKLSKSLVYLSYCCNFAMIFQKLQFKTNILKPKLWQQ